MCGWCTGGGGGLDGRVVSACHGIKVAWGRTPAQWGDVRVLALPLQGVGVHRSGGAWSGRHGDGWPRSFWIPACAGMTVGGAALRQAQGEGESPDPRSWVPAFAGATRERLGMVEGVAAERGPATRRDGRFANRPYGGQRSLAVKREAARQHFAPGRLTLAGSACLHRQALVELREALGEHADV